MTFGLDQAMRKPREHANKEFERLRAARDEGLWNLFITRDLSGGGGARRTPPPGGLACAVLLDRGRHARACIG